MAQLTIQAVNRDGLAPTFAAAAAGGDKFKNTGAEFIYIKNAGTGAITLTIVVNTSVDGIVVPNRTVSVPATTGERMVGPFDTLIYNGVNGDVALTYSGVTTVTVGIMRMKSKA